MIQNKKQEIHEGEVEVEGELLQVGDRDMYRAGRK